MSLDGVPLTFATGKTLGLLVYLAVESGRPHQREALAGLFWPDQPLKKALQNLRQALTQLRQTLHDRDDGASFLLVDRQSVCFNLQSDHRLDVAEFNDLYEKCLRHRHRQAEKCLPCLHRLRQMADLYGGDFLTHFNLDGSSMLDDWIVLSRESLRRQVIECLDWLANSFERSGDYRAALQYAWRQVALEPWREESHFRVMRLLAIDGQRSAALAHYDRCRRILEEELGVEPTPETTRLYEQIRDRTFTAGQKQPARPRASIPAYLLPKIDAPFVGREREIDDLANSVADPDRRLITINGPGGVGKSRLALEIACLHSGLFDDGVAFVPLAIVDSPQTLLPALAEAFGLVIDETLDLLTQLSQYLRGKELLVVLDNLEHLLDGVDQLAELLRCAPGLVLLVTSRERLRLQEEWVYPLEGLDVPPEDAPAIGVYSAAALFERRACQAYGGFQMAVEAPAVGRICRLVEGLPLALELAAAWAGLRSCNEIADDLQESIAGLVSPLRNVPERQRSIRSAFDISWTRLSAQEQDVYKRLSVMRGGFNRPAALEIAGASPEILAALAAKSLVRTAANNRYELHELLRQFAAEQLSSDLSLEAETVERQARYFAAWMGRQFTRLSGAEQQAALQEILLDLENVRTSWKWALDNGDALLAAQLLEGLHKFHDVHARFQEGVELFRAAIERWQNIPDALGLLGKLYSRQGELLYPLGKYAEARSALEQALEISLRQGDAQEERFCLLSLSQLARAEGRTGESNELALRALSQARAAHAVQDLIRALFLVGDLRARAGELGEAKQYLSEGLSLAEQSGDLRLRLSNLNALGDLACHVGDYAEGYQIFKDCLAISQKLGDRFHISIHLNNMGTACHCLEEYSEATRLYEQSLKLCRETGDLAGQAIALSNLGEVAQILGDYDRALKSFAEGLAIARSLGDAWSVMSCLTNLGHVEGLRGNETAARRNLVEALRLAAETQTWLKAALILVNSAELMIQNGQEQQAAPLLMLLVDHPSSEKYTQERALQLLQQLKSPAPEKLSSIEEAAQWLLNSWS